MQTFGSGAEEFSDLSPQQAAIRLLGCRLVTPECIVQIVETEAYCGPDDPGSHAFRGETPRNRVMFSHAGLLYMYFNYGNHWMANVVAGPPGKPGAVLLRAALPIAGKQTMTLRRPNAKTEKDLLSGPGKLAAALALTGADYGTNLLESESRVRLELQRPVSKVVVTTRIGLAENRGAELLLRYIDASHLEWASRPPSKTSTHIIDNS